MTARVALRSFAVPCGLVIGTLLPADTLASPNKLPLVFEPNKGQTAEKCSFIARGIGYGLFLRSDEALLRLNRRGGDHASLRMEIAGADPDARTEPLDPLPGESRYLIGDSAKWVSGVGNFGRVRFRDVYPQTDVIYYGSGRDLEYDFVVRPGGDPKRIRLQFAQHTGLVLKGGDLSIRIRGGEVRLRRPLVFQEVAGRRKMIPGGFRLQSDGSVSFEIGRYDRRVPLIIDPVLVYSSYLGGGGLDGATAIAVDAAGNAYVAGWTASVNFPVSAGAPQTIPGGITDAFVMKLNPSGTARLFSTYIGGSSDDFAYGIALDPSGNILLSGTTYSANFPTVNANTTFAGNTDAFLTKLSPSGALLFSTLLGGAGNDQGRGVATDSVGNAYIAGATDSTSFPVTSGVAQRTLGGGFDAFVAKFNASGVRLYSTFLGGTSLDEAASVAVDNDGSAWIAGATFSSNFPVKNAAQAFGGFSDAFIAKLDPAASTIVFATFLGGSMMERAQGVALDASGNAYVTGFTSSANFPATAGAYRATAPGSFPDQDAFAAKYGVSGAQVYATYLGGTKSDSGLAVQVDATGSAYVAGQTESADFPTVSAVGTFGGSADAFLAKINANGTGLSFSTFLGGGGVDSARSLAVGSYSNAYLAGLTNSLDLPARPVAGALQPNAAGGIEEGFVAMAGTCDYTAAPPAIVPAGGGSSTIAVTTGQDCLWSAASASSWITIAGAGSGRGSGNVTLTVAPNSGGARTGSLIVADRTVTITQAGGACTFSLSHLARTFPAAGGTGRVFISTGPNCSWNTPTPGVNWITVSNGASGSGNGEVTYVVSANPAATARSLSLTIGGTTYRVTQSGSCAVALTPGSVSAPEEGIATTIVVGATCTWDVGTDANWLRTLQFPNAVHLIADPNFAPRIRTATVQIGSEVLTVSQAASARSEAERLVRLLFFELFGRLPNAGDLQQWVGPATVDRASTAFTLFTAPETALRSRYVTRLYVGLLGRRPEFSGWIFQRNTLAALDAAGTPAAARDALVGNFIRSPEFHQRFGTPDNAELVRIVYRQIIGREASQAEVDWQVSMMTGPNAQVVMARNTLLVPEAIARLEAEAVALLIYHALLLREGHPADISGVREALDGGKSLRQVIEEVTGTSEFQALYK